MLTNNISYFTKVDNDSTFYLYNLPDPADESQSQWVINTTLGLSANHIAVGPANSSDPKSSNFLDVQGVPFKFQDGIAPPGDQTTDPDDQTTDPGAPDPAPEPPTNPGQSAATRYNTPFGTPMTLVLPSNTLIPGANTQTGIQLNSAALLAHYTNTTFPIEATFEYKDVWSNDSTAARVPNVEGYNIQVGNEWIKIVNRTVDGQDTESGFWEIMEAKSSLGDSFPLVTTNVPITEDIASWNLPIKVGYYSAFAAPNPNFIDIGLNYWS